MSNKKPVFDTGQTFDRAVQRLEDRLNQEWAKPPPSNFVPYSMGHPVIGAPSVSIRHASPDGVTDNAAAFKPLLESAVQGPLAPPRWQDLLADDRCALLSGEGYMLQHWPLGRGDTFDTPARLAVRHYLANPSFSPEHAVVCWTGPHPGACRLLDMRYARRALERGDEGPAPSILRTLAEAVQHVLHAREMVKFVCMAAVSDAENALHLDVVVRNARPVRVGGPFMAQCRRDAWTQAGLMLEQLVKGAVHEAELHYSGPHDERRDGEFSWLLSCPCGRVWRILSRGLMPRDRVGKLGDVGRELRGVMEVRVRDHIKCYLHLQAEKGA